MQATNLSRLLPYALLAFVAVAAWTMESTPLLAVVVLGTVGVAIGTAIASKNAQKPQPKL